MASKLPGRSRHTPSVSASSIAMETLGLIVIVVLILALTITRSWHHIHWSIR
jgi:hypothetical protein